MPHELNAAAAPRQFSSNDDGPHLDYHDFISSKSQVGNQVGFEPNFLPDGLFPFQRALCEWAIRKGRAALFEFCGLGKTYQQLVWAENVVRHANRPVLVLTPLSVSAQTVREGAKFGIDCVRSQDGKFSAGARIVVTNYERLGYFSPDDFAGAVADESGGIKHFDSRRTASVIEFFRTLPYRLLCTATAAPNDYIELGTSAEALGEMGFQDMITRFFKQQTSKDHLGWGRTKYVMRTYAEHDFWRWVCSWARACRYPSDLGFDDGRYLLPELRTTEYVILARTRRPGTLFDMPAVTLEEQREERHRTLPERCEKVAALVAAHEGHSIVFCHLNDEGDLLEKIIPGSVQISGSDSDERKEEVIQWFIGEACLCQGNRPTISRVTTEKTANADSPNPSHIRRNTRTNEKSTCEPTISPTRMKNGGDGLPSNEQSSMPPGGRNTERMPDIGMSRSKRSRNTKRRTPRSDSASECEYTGSLPMNTDDSSTDREGFALFAEVASRETGDTSDSSSIIVAGPAESEGCSVRAAISDSENSGMIPGRSNGRPCTCGHASGKRILISKPILIGWGLNLQHCAHIVTFASHSFESYYQSVRRCWRFGQERPVQVDMVTSEGERGVLENLKRKAEAADVMFDRLVTLMNDHLKINRSNPFTQQSEVPSWLSPGTSSAGAGPSGSTGAPPAPARDAVAR